MLVASLLSVSCAYLQPVEVPPPVPPSRALPVHGSGPAVVRSDAPQFHGYYGAPLQQPVRPLASATPISQPYAPQPYSSPGNLPLAEAYQQPPSTVTATDPLVIPTGPSIYYAPVQAPPQPPLQARPQQVLQGQPGPALALDFKPNPAWRRAVIPPDSNAATVGRVPPPAAMPGFTIGAGDTVQIDVLGRPELLARSNVSGDGRITAALLGAVNVAGMTPAQAAEKLSAAYRDGQYLVSPQVTVTLVEYQSQQLTVLGEVRTPGRFPMRTRLSVLDGIALSGGITDTGASTAYLLRPEDSVVTRYEIDLDALIQSGAGQQYFELIAGDTLVVPKAQLFYIYGEVKSPNAYKLKPGMTVIQALSLAGGLTDKGSDRRIDIRRQSNSRLASVSASLNDTLQADDVVYVRERLF